MEHEADDQTKLPIFPCSVSGLELKRHQALLAKNNIHMVFYGNWLITTPEFKARRSAILKSERDPLTGHVHVPREKKREAAELTHDTLTIKDEKNYDVIGIYSGTRFRYVLVVPKDHRPTTKERNFLLQTRE